MFVTVSLQNFDVDWANISLGTRSGPFFILPASWLVIPLFPSLLSSAHACLQLLCATSPKIVDIAPANLRSACALLHYSAQISTATFDHKPEQLARIKIQFVICRSSTPISVFWPVYPWRRIFKTIIGCLKPVLLSGVSATLVFFTLTGPNSSCISSDEWFWKSHLTTTVASSIPLVLQ